MAMQKIIVSVINDLVTDQRVHRICSTLHAHDFQVLLIGRKLKYSKFINRNYTTKRIKCIFNKSFLFYAEYNIRLFLFLIFQKADIFLANDVDTLIPNYYVSKLKNKKLVFDSHEYFSEVPELNNRAFVKKFWQKIENYYIPKVKNSYTVCRSIADLYSQKFGIHPIVIRNVPIKRDNINEISKNNKKTIIYQGAVNLGRGIELLLEAMVFLPEYEFVIAGIGDIQKEIQIKIEKLQLENRVKMIGRIEPQKLHEITRKAHLGISIEENIGLNYYVKLAGKNG